MEKVESWPYKNGPQKVEGSTLRFGPTQFPHKLYHFFGTCLRIWQKSFKNSIPSPGKNGLKKLRPKSDPKLAKMGQKPKGSSMLKFQKLTKLKTCAEKTT